MRRTVAWSAAALIATASLAGACAGGERAPPAALFDGSRPAELTVALEGVETRVVRTRAVLERGSPGTEQRSSCLESWAPRRVAPTSVWRVSVQGESVTFRDVAGSSVLGCDNSAGAREDDRRWCGAAYGRLHGGRLLDPRLDLLCTDADGDPLAFAWIEPDPGTRFVVVRQDGYAEAYVTAGGLPVRVASATGIDVAASVAVLDVSEHDRNGALIRRYAVEARVAG